MPISQMAEEAEKGQEIVKVTQLEGAIQDLHPGCLAPGSPLCSSGTRMPE